MSGKTDDGLPLTDEETEEVEAEASGPLSAVAATELTEAESTAVSGPLSAVATTTETASTETADATTDTLTSGPLTAQAATALEEGDTDYSSGAMSTESTVYASASVSRTVLQSILPSSGVPEASFNFVVCIGVELLGDFREVSGIGYSVDPFEWAEGGNNESVQSMPFRGPGRYSKASLRWGTVVWTTLYDWMRAVEVGRDFRRDVWIMQLGRSGNPVRMVRLAGAWPVEWSAANLNSMETTWAMEEVKISYRSVNLINLSSTAGIASSVFSMACQVLEAPVVRATLLWPGWFDATAASSVAFNRAETWGGDGKKPATIIQFPFNPEKMTLVRDPDWGAGQGASFDWKPLWFNGNRADILKFTALLDESEFRGMSALLPSLPSFLSPVSAVSSALGFQYNTGSVLHAVQGLYFLTRVARTTDLLGNEEGTRPPMVIFLWEEFQFRGVVDNIEVTFLLWDKYGRPKRAEVHLSLKGRLIDPALGDSFNGEDLFGVGADSAFDQRAAQTTLAEQLAGMAANVAASVSGTVSETGL